MLYLPLIPGTATSLLLSRFPACRPTFGELAELPWHTADVDSTPPPPHTYTHALHVSWEVKVLFEWVSAYERTTDRGCKSPSSRKKASERGKAKAKKKQKKKKKKGKKTVRVVPDLGV